MANEIEYTKYRGKNIVIRRQIIRVSDGWVLSNSEEIGKGPKSLRGYDGGTRYGSTRIHKTFSDAENRLIANGWTRTIESLDDTVDSKGYSEADVARDLVDALDHDDVSVQTFADAKVDANGYCGVFFKTRNGDEFQIVIKRVR